MNAIHHSEFTATVWSIMPVFLQAINLDSDFGCPPLRCVAEQQRTLALSFQSMMFRLFGFIPETVLFVVIIFI